MAVGTSQAEQDPEVKLAENRYIVMFKDQPAEVADAQAAQMAIQQIGNVLGAASVPQDSVIHRYKWASRGFAGRFAEQQVRRLREHPLVDHVVKDVYYQAIQYREAPSKSGPSEMMASQTTPWGINRVNGPIEGTGKTAWILDSGIDLDHPDLNVDVNSSASFIANETADDGLGHGTYVAGLLAAKNNTQGAVGVAAGATVVAVKVCDSGGGCFVSDVKGGVDYVAGSFSAGDVANLSLGFPKSAPGISNLESSITSAANSGLKFTIAAGNDSDDANNYSPARVEHSNVWTVSAYDINDAFAISFSNFGNPPIEYSAPGVDIRSLLIGGGAGMGFAGPGSEDGTSYASPIIAGLLLAAPNGIATDGVVSGDPDGTADPITVAATSPPPPSSIDLTGPVSLLGSQQGTWTASTTGGSGGYTYEWEYRERCTNLCTWGPWTDISETSDELTRDFGNSQQENREVQLSVAVQGVSDNLIIDVVYLGGPGF